MVQPTPMEGPDDPRTGLIIGAAIEVHKQLGSGFLEAVYQEALALEMGLRQIPYRREVELVIRYKGTVLRCPYRADFICFNDILIETKAISSLGGVEQAQLLNYLKATGLRLGLLINFGGNRVEVKRMRLDRPNRDEHTALCES